MNSQSKYLKSKIPLNSLITAIFLFSNTSLYADWSFIGLGSLGGNYSTADAINDSGQIVGRSLNAAGETKAFITQPGGVGITDLFPSISTSYAQDINNIGQVTGAYYLPTSPGQGESPFHAFVTDANGQGIVDLGIDSKMNSGISINNSGQVLGRTFEMDGSSSTFITGADGKDIRILDTFKDKSIIPTGINEDGKITGWTGDWSMPRFSVITGSDGMDMREIKGLPGYNSISASDINDAGQIVGYVNFSEENIVPLAFLTAADGSDMMNLGVLKGDNSSSATGVNDLGEVIGHSSRYDLDYDRIFLYSHE